MEATSEWRVRPVTLLARLAVLMFGIATVTGVQAQNCNGNANCNDNASPPDESRCDMTGHPGLPCDSSETCDSATDASPCNNFSWGLWGCVPRWSPNAGYDHVSGRIAPGFPLNLDLAHGPAAPGLPARSTDPILGSFAMVSQDASHSFGPNPYPQRPTHAGVLDMVTGTPLYQDTDFELPFGSAVFRHIRTNGDAVTDRYADELSWMQPTPEIGSLQLPAPYHRQNAFWDWNGQAWMMGEAPVLLIDASYADLQPTANLGTRVSYLLFDAHHTIAFPKIGENAYGRSPLFDASLSVAANGNYIVTMARGSLRYTFEPQNVGALWTVAAPCTDDGVPNTNCIEDSCLPWPDPDSLDEACRIDAHLQPPDGPGIPYYALLRTIEDRSGNKIEIKYVTDHTDYDQPWGCDKPGTECCTECCNNCNERGQIRSIKLIPAGTTTGAAWTLIYTYRPFAPASTFDSGVNFVGWRPDIDPVFPPATPPAELDLWYQHQVHSIHVYRYDISDSQIEGYPQPTLNPALFYGPPVDDSGWLKYLYDTDPTTPYLIDGFASGNTERIRSFDDYDGIDATHSSIRGLPNDWEICVQYLYQEPHFAWYYYADSPADPLDGNQYYRAYRYGNLVGEIEAGDYSLLTGAANLLKASVKRKRSDNSVSTTNTAYLYGPRDYLHNDSDSPRCYTNFATGLRAIFTHDTLESIRKEMPTGWSINEIFTIGTGYWGDETGNDTVLIRDADQPVAKPIRAVADIYMRDYNQWNDNVLDDDIIDDLDLDTTNLFVDHRGRNIFVDRRDGEKVYRIHRFRQYPTQPSGSAFWYDQAVFHSPFRYHTDDPNNPWALVTAGHAFYITVIDEIVPEPNDIPEIQSRGTITSRRAVGMNVWGGILWERTWKCDDEESCNLTSSVGYKEEFEYDTMNRLIERRSKGWSVADEVYDPVDGSAEEGLVYFFEYDPDITDPPQNPEGRLIHKGELKKSGIKQGNHAGAVSQVLMEVTRQHPNRPDLITEQKVYPNPGSTNETQVTTYTYDIEEPPSDPPPGYDEWMFAKINAKTVKGPAARFTDGGPLVRPVEKWKYDEGKLTHHGKGLESTTGTTIQFFCDVTEYGDDNSGPARDQKIADIVDAPITGDDGFQRVPPPELEDEDALELRTEYSYDATFGLNKIIHPNLRETHIVYNLISDTDVDVWTFKDVVTPALGGPHALSPIELVMIRGGRVFSTTKIAGDALAAWPPAAIHEENYQSHVISVTTPQYDAAGRPVSVATGEPDDSSMSVELDYDFTGNVSRQLQPDGTIMRYVYDMYGRLRNTYQGTSDTDGYWGGETPDPPTDDLVLVERRYYNEAVGDADAEWIRNIDQLIATRSYRNKPEDQYGESNQDSIGAETQLEYDWRMRQVAVRRYNEPASGNPVVLSQTLTWLDNMDRPRLVAEYSAAVTLPEQIDPRTMDNDVELPTAAAIIAEVGPPTLLSLTETIYNLRGQAEEVRQYNLDHTDGSSYSATMKYFDHANRPVEVHAPNSPVRQYVYNAKGQQVISSSLVTIPDGQELVPVEITRTETKYDDQDRAYETVNYERLHNASGFDPLGPSNSVRTFARTWYDKANRVIATANYGTNCTTDQFVNTNIGDLPAYNGDAPPVQTSTGPLVTRYVYDDAGRQSDVFHPHDPAGPNDPSHTTTHYEYDGFGRVLLMTENADGASELRRHTAYRYDGQGRLSMMAAVFPSYTGALPPTDDDWDQAPGDGTLQITQFIYGALVVDESYGEVSAHNAWIAEVHYPNEANGLPDAANALKFTYYSDGSVASRTDPRGMILKYAYDDLGRRTDVFVDDEAWFHVDINPGELGPQPPRPLLRLSRIHYDYDPNGRPTTVTAWALDRSSGADVEDIVAENAFDYDGFGNLRYDHQQHDDVVGTESPIVQYGWEFSPQSAGNFNRPTGITYPARPAAAGATIEFHYGNNTSDRDSALSRMTRIDGPGGALAEYLYGGMSRRVSTLLGGNTVSQSVAGTAGCPGLDRFGRLADLQFESGSTTLQQFQYGYDLSGNRTYAATTHAPTPNGSGGWTSHVNDRSYLYAYDALDRLVSAKYGELDDVEEPTDITSTKTTAWDLDILGNWTAGTGTPPASVFQQLDSDGNGGLDQTRTLHHAVSADNRIVEVKEIPFGSTNVSSTTFVHDSTGNLVFDGVYVYQYDALNRLVQVNEVGGAYFTEHGALRGVPGALLGVFAYDGLGRLAYQRRAQAENQPAAPRVDYYYDGVRRIAERIFSPYTTPTNWPSTGCEPCDADCNGTVNPFDIQPFLNLLTGATPCSTCAGDTNYNGTTNPFDVGNFIACLDDPVLGTEAQREYVYGPEYVDEFVCQFPAGSASPANPIYYLQDANYNVTGLVSGGGTGQPPAGTVLTQYVYEPYGQVLTIDAVEPESQVYNTVAHQGLFFEAFGASLTGDTPLQPMAPGLYYNRNRWYSPTLGRFTSKDPNETAMPVVAALAMNAQSLSLSLAQLNVLAHYFDGMNLYSFGGSNPIMRRDALGLEWQDITWEDDLLAAVGMYFGEKAFAAEHALGMFKALAAGAAQAALETMIVAMVPGGAAMVGAYHFAMGYDDAENNGLTWSNGIEMFGGLAGMGLGMMEMMSAFQSQRAALSARVGQRAGAACFVAGTNVVLADGSLRRIEDVRVGDTVLCDMSPDRLAGTDAAAVTSIFERLSPDTLELTVQSVQGDSVITTTNEHPFYSLTSDEFKPACQLSVGEVLLSINQDPCVVTAVCRNTTATKVYNIEVADSHNYYVAIADTAILVHNGCGFETFAQLKYHLGPAGNGRHWHHIVEQSQIRGSGAFAARNIHNTDNVYSIPASVNSRLNVHYGRPQPFTNGLTVREWLMRYKSFDEQREYGYKMLRELGGITPLPVLK